MDISQIMTNGDRHRRVRMQSLSGWWDDTSSAATQIFRGRSCRRSGKVLDHAVNQFFQLHGNADRVSAVEPHGRRRRRKGSVLWADILKR